MNLGKSFAERIKENLHYRNFVPQEMSFGNAFLDHALDGIWPDDLVIVTARTGGGKTELVSHIAYENALRGKKVLFLALEAYKGEIEDRILFRELANAFFMQQDWRSSRTRPDFQKWSTFKQEDILNKFMPEVVENISIKLKTLTTVYRQERFSVDDFEAIMNFYDQEVDLIILDHLHFLDWDEDNENLALKTTVKKIREIQANFRKPVVLVCQLRKRDKRTEGLVPELEEIHGASEIVKIATKIIATAPAYDRTDVSSYILPTYFGILKNRRNGSRCRYSAVCGFDKQANMYTEKYELGEMNYQKTEFKEILPVDFPQWRKDADYEKSCEGTV